MFFDKSDGISITNSDIDLDKVLSLAEDATIAKQGYDAVNFQLQEARENLRIRKKAVEDLEIALRFDHNPLPMNAPLGVRLENIKPHKQLDISGQIEKAKERVEICNKTISSLTESLSAKGVVNVEKNHTVRQVKAALKKHGIELDVLERF